MKSNNNCAFHNGNNRCYHCGQPVNPPEYRADIQLLSGSLLYMAHPVHEVCVGSSNLKTYFVYKLVKYG